MEVDKKLYPEWNEKLHRDVTKRIATSIKKSIDNFSSNSILKLISENKEPERIIVNSFIENVNLPWLKHISVFVSNGSCKTIDSNGNQTVVKSTDRNLSAIISNSKIYQWNNELKDFITEDVSVQIENPYGKIFPFNLSFNKLEPIIYIASLFFNMPIKDMWSIDYISYVL